VRAEGDRVGGGGKITALSASPYFKGERRGGKKMKWVTEGDLVRKSFAASVLVGR